MLSLHKLEVFLAVARERKISRAAETLFMTQAAVSQHIHDLETTLGVTLLHRRPQGVSLTPAGEVLLGYAQRILGLAMDAERSIAQLRQPASGELRLGLSLFAAYVLGTEWLCALRALYPAISLSLRTQAPEHLERDLAEERLDAIVLADEEMRPQIHVRSAPIGEVSLGVVLAELPLGQAADAPLMLRDLAEYPWIMPPRTCRLYQPVQHTLLAHGVKPNVVAEFDSFFLMQEAVLNKTGIAIMPRRFNMTSALPLWVPVTELAELRYTLRVVWADELPPRPRVCAFLKFLSRNYPWLSIPSGCRWSADESPFMAEVSGARYAEGNGAA